MELSSSSLHQHYEVREDDQYIPILIAGRISSFLSMMGSAFVIFIAWKSLKTKILHRLIFGLSVADLISSVSLFFMPFSIPSYVGLTAGVGTHATCTLTGFFLQFCVTGGCCYNAYLSLYYFLLVHRNWKERDFKKWMEVTGHAFAITVPFLLALWSAITQSINPQLLVNGSCMASPWPWGCDLDPEFECTRSSLELVRMQAMPMVVLIVVFSVTGFVCTGLVYCKVQNTIKRSSMHRFQGDAIDRSQSDRLVQVQIQSGLYSLVYFNSMVWPILAMGITEGHATDPEGLHTKKLGTGLFVLELLFWLLFPLQGFLNFFVFTRVKAKQWKKVEPDHSIFWIYKQIIFSIKVPNVTTTSMPRSTTQQGSSTRMISPPVIPTPQPPPQLLPNTTTTTPTTTIQKGNDRSVRFGGSSQSDVASFGGDSEGDGSSSSTANSHTQ